MKILYITNHLSWGGGLERVMSVKTSDLIDLYQCEIHILTFDAPPGKRYFAFHPSVKFHNVALGKSGINRFIERGIAMRKADRDLKPDVISVCDDGVKGFFAPLFLMPRRCPLVYERHASRLLENRWWMRKIMGLLAPLYDRFVVLTRGNAREWGKYVKTEVIPNSLTFYPDSVSPSNNRKNRVIAVGKYCKVKGFDRLVEAWDLLRHDVEGWELHIYGPEADGGALRSQVMKLNLEREIILHPFTNDIRKEYETAAIYVLPSRSEGFGIVLIEAMACGLPCVAFDCPCGPRDIIKHNEDGFLVEDGDVAMLAKALRMLMMEPNLRERFSTAARRNVMRYSRKTIASEWNRILCELVISEMR